MNSPAPSPFWWVEPLIVFFGIVISIAIAAFTISENRQIARKKATLDIIEASESRPFYRDLYITFLKYRNDDAFRDRILRPASDQDRAARNSCWTYS